MISIFDMRLDQWGTIKVETIQMVDIDKIIGYMTSRVDVNLWLMYCKADPQKCLPIINLYFKGALDACKSTNAILSKCGRVHPAIRQYVYNQVIRNEKENYKKVFTNMSKYLKPLLSFSNFINERHFSWKRREYYRRWVIPVIRYYLQSRYSSD